MLVIQGSGTEEIDGGGVMDTERVFVAEPEVLQLGIGIELVQQTC